MHLVAYTIYHAAYPAVVACGSTHAVVGGLEQTISPEGKSITNVHCDAALDGIDGRPLLGFWHCVPDVANLKQLWVHILHSSTPVRPGYAHISFHTFECDSNQLETAQDTQYKMQCNDCRLHVGNMPGPRKIA